MYTLALVVTDGLNRDSASVTVTLNIDSPVVADAGEAATVASGAVVTLNGVASVNHALAAADPLTYSWRQTEDGAPTVALTNANTSMPTFTAPATTAVLTFSLRVGGSYNSIASGSTDTDTVTITVAVPPTANAGSDLGVPVGMTVALDGSGSRDPGGELLTYLWEQVSGIAGSIDDRASSRPIFTASSTAGEVVISLIVRNESGLSSAAATVRVTVYPELTLTNPGPQNFTRGQIISVELPAAIGGNGSYTYTLTGGVVSGLGLSFNASNRVLSGMFDNLGTFGSTTGVYTVRDTAGGNASLTLVVNTFDRPTLTASIPDTVTYTAGVQITDLTLPEGENGFQPLTYTLSGALPPDLSFDSGNRILSGTPVETGTFPLTYRVEDANGIGSEDSITVTVNASGLPTANITVVGRSAFRLPFSDTAFGFLSGETVAVHGMDSVNRTDGELTYQWTGTGGAGFLDSTAGSPGLTLPALRLGVPGCTPLLWS